MKALSPARILTAAVLALVAFAVVGCTGGETPPPASIRAWQEPTDTASGVTQEASINVSAGSLEPAEQARLEKRVQLLGVGYAAEGAYLIVTFKAPPKLAVLWQPSQLYVVDERTGIKYDRVPHMPKIGVLIARPVKEGQPGYVMLENTPRLPTKSLVTVHLGGFVKKNVSTEATGDAPVSAP